MLMWLDRPHKITLKWCSVCGVVWACYTTIGSDPLICIHSTCILCSRQTVNLWVALWHRKCEHSASFGSLFSGKFFLSYSLLLWILLFVEQQYHTDICAAVLNHSNSAIQYSSKKNIYNLNFIIATKPCQIGFKLSIMPTHWSQCW